MAKKTNEVTIEINPSFKQNLAWMSLLDHETVYIVFGGGGGGGKSWLGCEWLFLQCIRYPDVKYFIAREKLKTLKQSTLLSFFKVAKHYGFKKDVHFFYHQQESYIDFPNGSRIDLLELKYNPSDPLFEDLGSLEYTGGWIEEAGEIDIRAFDTIKTRIGRWSNDKYNISPKLLVTCNPKKNWLYTEFYKPWKEKRLPKDCVFIQALVDDNPYSEALYKNQLLSIKDPIKRQRLLLGDWEYDSDVGTLMDYDAITDLWSNTATTSKERYMTVDVARFGKDRTVFMFWEGFKLYKVMTFKEQGTDVTVQKIKEYSRLEKIPYSHITIDEDGVGGGVVDQLRGVKGFINNSSALVNYNAKDEELEKQNFVNLKTQCTFMMADKVNNHEVEISVEDDEFREALSQELEVIRRDDVDNDNAKLKLIPKDDIKQIIGHSPDLSDCFIMRMFFALRPEFRVTSEEAIIRERKQRQVLQAATPFNRWGI
jgi:phage terminase large subunit